MNDEFLEHGPDRKEHYVKVRDPQEHQRSLDMGDIFYRVEVEQDLFADTPSAKLPCLPAGTEVAALAGITDTQWKYIKQRFPSLMEDYRVTKEYYRWDLPKLLSICKDKLLADYHPVAGEAEVPAVRPKLRSAASRTNMAAAQRRRREREAKGQK